MVYGWLTLLPTHVMKPKKKQEPSLIEQIFSHPEEDIAAAILAVGTTEDQFQAAAKAFMESPMYRELMKTMEDNAKLCEKMKAERSRKKRGKK